jgi:hypothetical protein
MWRNKHQGQMMRLKIQNLQPGDICVRTDFSAVIDLKHADSTNCEHPIHVNLDVALVYSRPVGDGPVEVEVWRAFSHATNDSIFHHRLMDDIYQHYFTLGRLTGTFYIFSDRCAKQYSGNRNFGGLVEKAILHGITYEHWIGSANRITGKGPTTALGMMQKFIFDKLRFGEKSLASTRIMCTLFSRKTCGSLSRASEEGASSVTIGATTTGATTLFLVSITMKPCRRRCCR